MKSNISSTGSNARPRVYRRAVAVVGLVIIIATGSTKLQADTGSCGGASITLTFTDVPSANIFFCSIAEAFFSGLTNGTDATHYNPSANVPREQMAAFVTRTMDQSVKRGSKPAALQQFWTTQGVSGLTTVGTSPQLVQSDGADLWVANSLSNTVSRVRGSDGKLLDTWTGTTRAFSVLCAMGKVFIASSANPGRLYQIDPTQPAGAVPVLATLGDSTLGIAFDGQRIWTANFAGSVSIVTLTPLSVTTVSTGFTSPRGILFDGGNIWVTDQGDNTIKKLDSSGNILLSVDMGTTPRFPTFDGTNTWVPNGTANSVSVVRATGALSGTVIATLTGNGLNSPYQAAFDGERILVTNGSGASVSLWRATDLVPLGTFPTVPGINPLGACSDGLNFWIALAGANKLARF